MGGAELQQSIIGRCLQQNGHDVSFATTVFDGRRDDEVIDGMKVFKTFDLDDGLPGLRSLHPRLTGLWQAMRKADADIYYQRCAGRSTGICAMFCRRYGKKFVYSGAHDSDFYPVPEIDIRERYLYQWGLRHADFVLVQTEKQKALLKHNYGLSGNVLPNVYPSRKLTRAEGYVLWVGNMRLFKRPLLCLDIARCFPDQRFVIVGGISNGCPELYRQLQSHSLPNVEFLGFQPLETTERLFDGASLLLNTSTVEGFPNTYLQAWSRGIPTVGTYDPDKIIERYDLGRVFSKTSDLGDWFRGLVNSCDDDRKRIQQCFEKHFSPQRYVDGMISLLDPLVEPSVAACPQGVTCD